MSRRLVFRWWLVGVTLLAAAIRFSTLGLQSFWFDEAFTVVETRLPLLDSLSSILTLGAYSPFFYLLLRPVTAILGQSEFSYRFIAAIFGVLTVPLVYRVGSRWIDPRAGFLAASMLAICPFHLLYSQDARMYTMMGFFSLAAMASFEEVRHARGRWWPFIIYSALAYLSHYAAIFLVYVQAVCLLPGLRKRGRFFRRWFLAQVVALLPLLPWFAFYLVETWETRALGIGWIPKPGGLAIPVTLWNFISADTSTWTAWVVILMVLVGVVLVSGVLSRRRARYTLIWWLFLPLVINFVVSLRQPLYVDRYFMGSLPAYLLLLAAGIVAWRRRWLRWGSALAIVGVMLWGTVRILGQDPYFAKEDWRAATAEVESGLAREDIVVLQDVETLIGVSAYRTREWPLVLLESGDEAGALDSGLEAHGRVWLVVRSPHESNHRLCKSDPFDAFTETPPFVGAWLLAHRDQIAVDLRLPGLSVMRIDGE